MADASELTAPLPKRGNTRSRARGIQNEEPKAGTPAESSVEKAAVPSSAAPSQTPKAQDGTAAKVDADTLKASFVAALSAARSPSGSTTTPSAAPTSTPAASTTEPAESTTKKRGKKGKDAKEDGADSTAAPASKAPAVVEPSKPAEKVEEPSKATGKAGKAKKSEGSSTAAAAVESPAAKPAATASEPAAKVAAAASASSISTATPKADTEKAAAPSTAVPAASTNGVSHAEGKKSKGKKGGDDKPAETKPAPAVSAPAPVAPAPVSAPAPAPAPAPTGTTAGTATNGKADKKEAAKGRKETKEVAAPAPAPAPEPTPKPTTDRKDAGKRDAKKEAPVSDAKPKSGASAPVTTASSSSPAKPSPAPTPAHVKPTPAPTPAHVKPTQAPTPAHVKPSPAPTPAPAPVQPSTAPRTNKRPATEESSRRPAPIATAAHGAGSARSQVVVPRSLLDWCISDEGREMASQVAHRTGVLSVKYSVVRPGHGIFEITATSKDNTQFAANLLETHLNHQEGLQSLAAKQAALGMDLEAAMKELDLGLRCEFTVPAEVVGLVIGAKGAHLNRVKDATGVERIVVDKDTNPPVIRIRGDDADQVAEARRQLEYTVEKIDLTPQQVRWIVGPGGATINDIKSRSGVFRIDVEDSVDPRVPPQLKILGLKTTVHAAMMLVEAQLEYQSKYDSVVAKTKEVESELRKLDRSYGDHVPKRENRAPRIAAAEERDARPERKTETRGGAGRRRRGSEDEAEEAAPVRPVVRSSARR